MPDDPYDHASHSRHSSNLNSLLIALSIGGILLVACGGTMVVWAKMLGVGIFSVQFSHTASDEEEHFLQHAKDVVSRSPRAQAEIGDVLSAEVTTTATTSSISGLIMSVKGGIGSAVLVFDNQSNAQIHLPSGRVVSVENSIFELEHGSLPESITEPPSSHLDEPTSP